MGQAIDLYNIFIGHNVIFHLIHNYECLKTYLDQLIGCMNLCTVCKINNPSDKTFYQIKQIKWILRTFKQPVCLLSINKLDMRYLDSPRPTTKLN